MPFKDPEKRREYHRIYMARKRLWENYVEAEFYGHNGRPIKKPDFDELAVDLELVWEGKNSGPYDWKYYAVKEAAGILGIHPNTLRRMISKGKVKYLQEAPNCAIQIPHSEVVRLKNETGFNKDQ